MSVSVSSSVSSTRSTSRDANTGTISMTPEKEKSASHTPSRTWTPPDPSHSVSFTASLLPSLTKPSLSLTASHTLSSDRTNTVTVQVSNSYRTPTIHTLVALPFVFSPSDVTSWSANGVPILELHANSSTASSSSSSSSSQIDYIDVTLFAVDEDGQSSRSPYRSPIALSVESLPTYEERDILSVGAVGFPASLNITADNAILPAHAAVAMNGALPDPLCMMPASTLITGTIQIGIHYIAMNMEYFTKTALVKTTAGVNSTSISTQGSFCLEAVSIAQSNSSDGQGIDEPAKPSAMFFVADVPQALGLRETRMGYFSSAVDSPVLSRTNSSFSSSAVSSEVVMPGATLSATPLQWAHLESTNDVESISLFFHFPPSPSVLSSRQNISVDSITVNIGIGASHSAQIRNVTVVSCPPRYDTVHSVPLILFNATDGVVQMPYSVVSSVEPGDEWTCFVSSSSAQPGIVANSSARRLSGCMLHCPIPPSLLVDDHRLLSPLTITVKSSSYLRLRQSEYFNVTTVAWPHTLLVSDAAHPQSAAAPLIVAHARSYQVLLGTTTVNVSVSNGAALTLPGNSTLSSIELSVLIANASSPMTTEESGPSTPPIPLAQL
ncbi:Hypothetical protein, putative, partial [Bodo saltans]